MYTPLYMDVCTFYSVHMYMWEAFGFVCGIWANRGKRREISCLKNLACQYIHEDESLVGGG